MILTVFLLGVVVTGGLCCGGGGGSGSGGGNRITVPSCCPESRSPSGGPSRNSGATVCYFSRGRMQLKCIKGGRSAQCAVQATSEPRDDHYGGPTPQGEYLIGQHYRHSSYGVDWYNLYPKKEDNSGYYGYYQKTRKGRNTMGLHPGNVSLGCVTVKTSDRCSRGASSCYNSHPCWKSIKSVINSGSMRYKGSGYSGILYVLP